MGHGFLPYGLCEPSYFLDQGYNGHWQFIDLLALLLVEIRSFAVSKEKSKVIGLVVAMEEELLELRNRHFQGFEITEGLVPMSQSQIGDSIVVMAYSGMGKVNAAMAAASLVERYTVSALLISGLAGSLDDRLNIGDIVLASGAFHHDFDLRPILNSPGILPGASCHLISADPGILALEVEIANRYCLSNVGSESSFGSGAISRSIKCVIGEVASGDAIIGTKAQKIAIKKNFPDAICVDMESAALAQVALAAGVPWGAIRVISDFADDSFDMNMVVNFCVNEASSTIAQVISALVRDEKIHRG